MHLPDRVGAAGSWEVLPWSLKANLTEVLLFQAAFPARKTQGVLSAAVGSRSALPKQTCGISQDPKLPAQS